MYPISAKRLSASLRVWASTMAAVSSTTAEDLRLAKADCRLRVALSSNSLVTSTPLSAVIFCSMLMLIFLCFLEGVRRLEYEDSKVGRGEGGEPF